MIKEVTIPACTDHRGMLSLTVRLHWICPKCGGPRGPLFEGASHDGSLRLKTDCWFNDCLHIDYYDAVRKEASENGLND
jgi:hypothetical protein